TAAAAAAPAAASVDAVLAEQFAGIERAHGAAAVALLPAAAYAAALSVADSLEAAAAAAFLPPQSLLPELRALLAPATRPGGAGAAPAPAGGAAEAAGADA